MKSKTIKSIILMVAMLCLLCFPVQVMAETQQGTNGDELQLMEAGINKCNCWSINYFTIFF